MCLLNAGGLYDRLECTWTDIAEQDRSAPTGVQTLWLIQLCEVRPYFSDIRSLPSNSDSSGHLSQIGGVCTLMVLQGIYSEQGRQP